MTRMSLVVFSWKLVQSFIEHSYKISPNMYIYSKNLNTYVWWLIFFYILIVCLPTLFCTLVVNTTYCIYNYIYYYYYYREFHKTLPRLR